MDPDDDYEYDDNPPFEGVASGPAPRVQDIRRQWAVHEDEALAYRLQSEEIVQHYSGNKLRNAIVREDAPRAREAQRLEEQEALEERFRQLGVLQKQAENDERVAKMLAKKYKMGLLEEQSVRADVVKRSSRSSVHNQKEIVEDQTEDFAMSETSRFVDEALLGATALEISPSSSCDDAVAGPSKPMKFDDDSAFHGELTEDELRQIQEEKDAVLARRLQEQLEQYEKDQRLAVEAQDRELAKMLYEKERARLRRAKERARLKAEAAAAAAAAAPGTEIAETEIGGASARGPSRSSYGSGSGVKQPSTSSSSYESTSGTPPRIPDKARSSIERDDPISFRANPKPLPPQPSSSSRMSESPSHSSSDPIPPYMPIQGFNRIKKKQK